AAPSRMLSVSVLTGSQIHPATWIPIRIARPDIRGVGETWELRGPGSSIAPTRRANDSAGRTMSSVTRAAVRKAQTASIPSTMSGTINGDPVFAGSQQKPAGPLKKGMDGPALLDGHTSPIG